MGGSGLKNFHMFIITGLLRQKKPDNLDGPNKFLKTELH